MSIGTRRLILSLVVTPCLAMSGCGSKVPGTAAKATAGLPTKAVNAGPAPTEEECRAFGEAFTKAAVGGRIAEANDLIDWGALYETASSGLGFDDRARKVFLVGVNKSMQQKGGFLASLSDAAKSGGNLKVLRVFAPKGERSVLFRFIQGEDGGLNYFRMTLGRRPDGRVKAVDIFTFMNGEEMSQLFRRTFLIPLAAQQNRGLIGRLTNSEVELVKALPTIQAITDAIREGKHREALRLLDSLPPVLRDDKTFLVIRVTATQELGEAEYARAIDEFRAKFPNDPSLDLISIDGYLLKKQYDQALAAIDRLDKAVGGDPYLDELRANVLVLKGDKDAAYDRLRAAVDAEPDEIDRRWAIVSLSMQIGKFDDTLALLRTMERDFHIQFDDLRTVPDYAAFVASPQYQEWLKDHPVPAKPAPAGDPAPSDQGAEPRR